MTEFKLNEFITLKLENGKTEIYVLDEKFIQCKALVVKLPSEIYDGLERIKSVDDINEESAIQELPSKTEFWGHCSNMQVWVEHNYDTKLLRSNIAFPLLKRLTEVGDEKAKKIFHEEIAKRFENGNLNVAQYLIEEEFLSFLYPEERELLFFNHNLKLKKKIIRALSKGSSVREKALSILKGLAELGDLSAERQATLEIEKEVNEKNLTIYDLLVNQRFYRYLSRKMMLFKLLDENDAGRMLELEELIYKRFQELKPRLGWDDRFRRENLTLIPVNLADGMDNQTRYYTFTLKNRRVTSLNLNGFDDFSIPVLLDPILKLTSLKKLKMSLNEICMVPENISNLESLEELDLSDNSIISLPQSFKTLTFLRKLDLSRNDITYLPEQIGELRNLEVLNLNSNKLKKLPQSIVKLKKLRILSIGKNNLENLPKNIGNLNSLEILDISKNKLVILPKTLSELKSLRVVRTELTTKTEATLKILKKKGVYIDNL